MGSVVSRAEGGRWGEGQGGEHEFRVVAIGECRWLGVGGSSDDFYHLSRDTSVDTLSELLPDISTDGVWRPLAREAYAVHLAQAPDDVVEELRSKNLLSPDAEQLRREGREILSQLNGESSTATQSTPVSNGSTVTLPDLEDIEAPETIDLTLPEEDTSVPDIKYIPYDELLDIDPSTLDNVDLETYNNRLEDGE